LGHRVVATRFEFEFEALDHPRISLSGWRTNHRRLCVH
jgi:hypothetical protein